MLWPVLLIAAMVMLSADCGVVGTGGVVGAGVFVGTTGTVGAAVFVGWGGVVGAEVAVGPGVRVGCGGGYPPMVAVAGGRVVAVAGGRVAVAGPVVNVGCSVAVGWPALGVLVAPGGMRVGTTATMACASILSGTASAYS